MLIQPFNRRSQLYLYVFFISHYHNKYQLFNMLKIKHDINQQDLEIVDLHFVKSE